MSELPVVEFRGGPRERGASHGEQLRDEIGAFYDVWIEAMTRSHGAEAGYGSPAVGWSEADYVAYAGAHLPAAREYAPELVEEIEGIAEGSGVSFERLFLLNCFDEAACHGPGLLRPGRGCTAFAATGRATVDGVSYIGQGWDAPDYYPTYLFRVIADDQPDILVISHPGLLGGTGINQDGIAIVWNTLKASNAGIGVPATFVVRKALQSPELAELVGNVISSQRANGMNFIAADKDAAIDLELSPSRYHTTYSHGILHHANHFEAPEFLALEADLPLALPDSILRSGRMRELLERNVGSIDQKVLFELMQDHAAGPGSICRHDARGITSVTWVIYVPAEKKVWATNCNPCTEPFIEYSVESTVVSVT
jgi:isopenicillin-N N-acyltransferase like protein